MKLKKKLKSLRKTRKSQGITLADVYKKTKIWMAKLSGIENGYFKATEAEKKKIARVLKVAVGSIDWGS